MFTKIIPCSNFLQACDGRLTVGAIDAQVGLGLTGVRSLQQRQLLILS